MAWNRMRCIYLRANLNTVRHCMLDKPAGNFGQHCILVFGQHCMFVFGQHCSLAKPAGSKPFQVIWGSHPWQVTTLSHHIEIQTGHPISSSDFKILSSSPSTSDLLRKESILINKLKPVLYGNIGSVPLFLSFDITLLLYLVHVRYCCKYIILNVI